MKVDLQKPKPSKGWRSPGSATILLKKSLPFYKSDGGKYIHRIKTGCVYTRNGKITHTSYHFYCGSSGFISRQNKRKGEVMAKPPTDGILCATCEVKALGHGLGATPINYGHAYEFSPRTQFV